MSQIEFCTCGSPMSNYEKEHYGKCTACHQKDMEEQTRKRQLEEEKRRAEIKAKRQEALAELNRQLAQLRGKTIQEAVVDSWKVIGHSESTDVEATSISITCTDGTEACFSLGDHGCCEDYEYFIDIGVFVPEPEKSSASRKG